MVLEPSHLVTSPTRYGAVVNTLAFVRYDKILADPDNLSKAATDRTCSQRAVEREQIFIRLPEGHPVEFEPVGEFLPAGILDQDKVPIPFPESVVNRRAKPGLKILPIRLGPFGTII